VPIDKVSDIRQFPRLGKIRLGIKKEGQHGPYPQPVDYFVCPDEVKTVYGETPRELDVMFPSNDIELVAPQWYKCYSYSQGLLCKGDGKHCRRKVDVNTGDFASRDTKEWVMSDGNCEPEHCPKIGDKQCRKMMSLLFVLPNVPGLGVYQLNTSSFYSIVNLNSQIAPDGFIRPFTKGRIAFIPLKLSIGPQEVNPPGVGRKTVQVLSVRADVKLADIIRISRQGVAQVLLPTLDEEEPPEDLYPDEIISEEGEVADTKESNACHCPKPVPPDEVVQTGAECFHRACGGYLCTPPIDCYPGCPHIPLEEAWPEAGEEPVQPPGEGIAIDPVWLTETLKKIRWAESTAISWIASSFGIETQGSLTEVLQRLTREQAEEFTKELNDRVNKVQPGLFD